MSRPSRTDLEKTITICEGKKAEIGSNLGLVLEHNHFFELDNDHDGVISVDELEMGLREELRLPVSRTEIHRFFNIIDTDHDGKITEEEFRVFTRSLQRKLKKIFNTMDRNHDGKLDSEEVKLAIRALGLQVSSRQLRSVMTRLSSDQIDKELDFNTFRHALLLLPTINPEAIFEAYEAIPMDDDRPREITRMKEETLMAAIAAQLYAGGIAGCISRTSTAPLERFKVIVQSRIPGAATQSIFTELRLIFKESGFFGFWRGNGANCLKVAPETAAKFIFFEHGKKMIAKDPGNVTLSEKFMAGSQAGMIAQLMVYPLEVLKTRMSIARPGHYKGFSDCLSQIYQNRGIRGLYKGAGASTVGIIPYAGVDLMINSVIREQGAEYYRKRNRDPGIAILLGAGMISSTTAMSCTYPLNLIRTRLQASGMDGAPVYDGVVDCIRKSLAADGPRGLYRGFGANLLKVLPSTSISYAVYDVLRNKK